MLAKYLKYRLGGLIKLTVLIFLSQILLLLKSIPGVIYVYFMLIFYLIVSEILRFKRFVDSFSE